MSDSEPERRWQDELNAADKALLDTLSAGTTVAAAAARRFLSLRTANRRIAAIRRRARVSSTRELVKRFRESPPSTQL